MAFPLEIIEEFFEAKFDNDGQAARALIHFDGYAHWLLHFMQESSLLRITSDRDPYANAFPTLEIGGVFCDEVSLRPYLDGSGKAELILKTKGVESQPNYIFITKLRDGRMSLSATVGKT